MGSSTSLHMLSMMTADLRLMAVICWKNRPRCSRGPMMESVGASTCCTNVVAASLCTLGNLVNLVDALDERGDEGVDVDVADARATLAMVSVDFSFTSSRMSTITCASSGMISGRHAATALGLRSTKLSMSSARASWTARTGS